jgi:hypothetical protein
MTNVNSDNDRSNLQVLSDKPQIELGLQCVHLVSGEDIIGKVWVNDVGFTIEDPMIPQIRPNPNGQGVSIGLLPFRPFVEDALTIMATHVICVNRVNDQMQRLYAQYNSNIVIPDLQKPITLS